METLRVEGPATVPVVTGSVDIASKYAMLSVYYATLGTRFAVSGAPSMFVPPEAVPQSLESALAVLSADPQRLEQALWLVVRNTGIRRSRSQALAYPREIDPYLSRAEQEALDQDRRSYRVGASLFAGCLRACRDDDRVQFDALGLALSDSTIKDNEGLQRVATLLFDQSPTEYLASMRNSAQWRDAGEQLVQLEAEVGRSITTYVEELADTAAYETFIETLASSGSGRKPMVIYPVTSSISQDIDQLWTSATVTTLASGDFESLRRVTEPANWADGNDVIKSCHYVDDPITLAPTDTDLGAAGAVHGLLLEEAAVSWGSESSQQGSFRNVLNVSRTITGRPPGDQSIDIRFSLCRSISSEVLWDKRRGGILVNEGFLKVAPLGDERWRVTSRKLLRFSDRTPHTGATGWTDFGEMLNYLAPAALTWWVETETYSLGQRKNPGGQSGAAGTAGEAEKGPR